MKRLEVIANQSLREQLIEELEAEMPDIEYSLIPIVHGKGRRKRKEGTRTWPETNFYLLCFLEDEAAGRAAGILRDVARRFPAEGLCAAVSEAELV